MKDFILVLLILAFAWIGLRFTVAHFRRKSGCCGSSSYTPRRKKLKHIQYQKEFTVGGMHCEHCKNRVEEIVNDIDGAAGRVQLKDGKLTVFYEKEIPDALICARIEKAGYTIVACPH